MTHNPYEEPLSGADLAAFWAYVGVATPYVRDAGFEDAAGELEEACARSGKPDAALGLLRTIAPLQFDVVAGSSAPITTFFAGAHDKLARMARTEAARMCAFQGFDPAHSAFEAVQRVLAECLLTNWWALGMAHLQREAQLAQLYPPAANGCITAWRSHGEHCAIMAVPSLCSAAG